MEMITAYKEFGYGAIAITDHDTWTPIPEVEGIIVFQGCEHSRGEHWLEIKESQH